LQVASGTDGKDVNLSNTFFVNESGVTIVDGNLSIVDVLLNVGQMKLCIDQVGGERVGTCGSSRRYKENIIEYRNSTALITQLNVVKFKWKGRDASSYGLIAEDVEKVDPLLALKYKGRIENVDYDSLVALLIATVQELNEEVKELKIEVQELKG